MYVPKSEEEKKFLENYDPGEYPHPSVTVDAAVFALDKRERAIKVLLITRGGHPYKGFLALPGGFLNMDEELEAAVAREIEEETGLLGVRFEEAFVMGAVGRDPRDRVITVVYYALVDFAKVAPRAGDDAQSVGWYTLSRLDIARGSDERGSLARYTMILNGGGRSVSTVVTQIKNKRDHNVSYIINKDGGLAFDHAEELTRVFTRFSDSCAQGFATECLGSAGALIHHVLRETISDSPAYD